MISDVGKETRLDFRPQTGPATGAGADSRRGWNLEITDREVGSLFSTARGMHWIWSNFWRRYLEFHPTEPHSTTPAFSPSETGV